MKTREVLHILPAAAGSVAVGNWEATGRTGVDLAVAGAPRPAAGPAVPLPADLSWWREARFGMFVHWGPVSLRGTEIGWSRGKEIPVEEYDALYRRFDPSFFDARGWARLVKDAGMGYLVLTTKHHDGFCLWPSGLSDYDIATTPFRRDVVRELADACRDQGIVFCAYHSDWNIDTAYGVQTTRTGLAGVVVRAAKHIVRPCVRLYTDHILNRQAQINQAVWHFLLDSVRRTLLLELEVKKLRHEIDQLMRKP